LARALTTAVMIYRFLEGVGSGESLVAGTGFLQPTAIAFAPDGKGLAITNGTEIVLASLANGNRFRVTRRIQGTSGPITCLAINPSDAVSGSRDGWMCTWKFADGAPLSRFNTGVGIVSMLALPGQRAVATGHADGTVNVVSLADGKAVTITTSNSPVQALVLGPGGDSLVSGSEAGSVDSLSLLTGERLTTGKLQLKAGTRLTTMALVPAKTLLAVGTSSGQIIILDWPSLKIRTYLFDRRANQPTAKGVSFQILDPVTGRTVTYTLPCGAEIPTGATCVCNCVPGTASTPTYTPKYTPRPRITSPPVTMPGETITRPCTPTPVPPGYSCTCNCIPGR
jgi:WD40 repeat protein